MLKPFNKHGVVFRKSSRTEAAIDALRNELRCSIGRWLWRIDGKEPPELELQKHFEWACNEDERLREALHDLVVQARRQRHDHVEALAAAGL